VKASSFSLEREAWQMPYRSTHKQSIREIRNIDWKAFDPLSIIFPSLFSAREFAGSLRVTLNCLQWNPKQERLLKEMAAGELQTDNLQYEDYSKVGDHWEFLNHFIEKLDLDCSFSTHHAGDRYDNAVKMCKASERAMTIFSREIELPGIFVEILTAHRWKDLGYVFYEYYLKRHIQLDTGEGGHGDLTKTFNCDPRVLDHFWSIRLKLYQEGLKPKQK